MGLKFNDIDLKTNYNFVVIEVQGRGSPPVSRTILDHPLVHGDIELSAKLRSRDIVIRGYVYGSDLATKKDSLIKLITQAYEKECKLTFPDTNRSIYVKLAGEPIVVGPVGPSLNAQAYELSFKFIAQDPFFYGEDHDESGFRIVTVNANSPTYLISPRRKFLKREPSIKIEPYTVVNLLGKYGNFETDSDGDGLADGWSIITGTYFTAPMLKELNSSAVYGSKSQRLRYETTVMKAGGIKINAEMIVGHYYFARGWLRILEKPTDAQNINIAIATGFGNVHCDISKSSWQELLVVGQADDGSPYFGNITLFGMVNSAPPGNWDTLWDGAMVVNLTLMGYLPFPLREYFSNQVSKWEDLATTSTITAIDGKSQTGNDWLNELIPYVDSVATLGYAWGA